MLTATPRTERTMEAGDLGWRRSPLGLYVPETRHRYDRPVGIDLFAGAGGFSCGFHQAGFHMAAAVEMDYVAAVTYLVNLGRPPHLGGVKLHFDTEEREQGFTKVLERHLGLTGSKRRSDGVIAAGGTAGSGWIAGQSVEEQKHGAHHMWIADVRTLTGTEILAALDLQPGDVACVVGGPPCQGFSMAGKRNVMDPRNSLVFEFARLVCEIMPHTFVMENVPGIEAMVTPEGIPVIDAFCLAVADGGYGEYQAIKRALSTTGGRAVVKGAKKAKRGGHDSDAPVEQLPQAGRAAVDDGQPDLFSAMAVEAA